MTTRGRFIVFEGIDGSGTTTQAERLSGRLRTAGYPVQVESEPTRGPIGAILRQVIEGRTHLDPAALALAFAADRSDHLHNASRGILAMLEEGTWVVCDRYVLSSIAYQSAQGVDPGWIAEINRFAIQPDLTVFVDTPVEECLQRTTRRNARADYFEKQDSLTAALAIYREALPTSSMVGELVTVDGSQPQEAVTDEILGMLAKLGFTAPPPR
jgi:dTMP kinase